MGNNDAPRSLRALAAALASGETTSVALTQEALARIEATDGALNSFITVDRDGALAAATAADVHATLGHGKRTW